MNFVHRFSLILRTQLLLRIILNNDKIIVKQVAIQRLLQNLYGHSAQLDILAEYEAGHMHDFYCADPDKMHYKELADKVRYFKEPQRSEDAMVDVIDEYAKKYAYQKSVEIATNMLADKMSVEAVARYSTLPIEEVRKLAEKQRA